jgi:hypothetical protein
MEYAEDEDVGFAHALQESERVHEKLANVRLSVLWDRRTSLTEDPE